jgi:hypothetical protein
MQKLHTQIATSVNDVPLCQDKGKAYTRFNVGRWARASLVVVELDSCKPHVYRRPIDIRLNSATAATLD